MGPPFFVRRRGPRLSAKCGRLTRYLRWKNIRRKQRKLPAVRYIPLLAWLLVGGCDWAWNDEPVRTLNAHETAIEQMRATYDAQIDADPCAQRSIDRLGHRTISVIRSFRPRDCMDFLPAEVMRGVWFHGFEESGFVPDVDHVPLRRVLRSGTRNPESETFLDIDAEEALRRLGGSECRGTCAYAITFVGRRTRDAGNYYSGEGTHVVAVNAVLTGRLLGRVTTRVCLRGHECIDLQ